MTFLWLGNRTDLKNVSDALLKYWYSSDKIAGYNGIEIGLLFVIPVIL
jgi:hypothetical protein